MRKTARPSTFSITAHDPNAGEWGVAVASKFLAVGAVVPCASADIGAVATQAHANATFGPLGLGYMARGYDAESALSGLLAADADREQRQVGLVDAAGTSATFTGSECFDWSGGRTGPHFAAQGNILAGPEVVERLATVFEGSTGVLADRLLSALAAGQAAGGDSRGQQSAALLVVKAQGGYAGLSDRYIDLRVDDHVTPIAELQRLLELHKLYFFETRPEDLLPIDASLATRIQDILHRSGDDREFNPGVYDQSTRKALSDLLGKENLEGRHRNGPKLDRVVLEYLLKKYVPEQAVYKGDIPYV